jgi:hypothetical protein
MDLTTPETLRQLLARVRDPELSAEAHAEAAERLRELYPVERCVRAYADFACHGVAEAATVSFALRILYVHGRRRPDAREPKEAFRKIVAGRERPPELRTQAFLHLLLLDLDAAERAAEAHMPEMLVLTRAECLYPTVRPSGADAAYEEAAIVLLFH